MSLPRFLGGARKPKRRTASKKTPARKKRRGRSQPSGPWLWVLSAAVVLVIGGIGGLKWSHTRSGQATLLNLGADKMYGEIQTAAETALVPVLPGLKTGPVRARPDSDPDAHDWPAAQLADGAHVRCRVVPVSSEAPWHEVQLYIQQGLTGSGAKVLWAERLPAPGRRQDRRVPDEARDLLRIDVGVPGKPTHTLVLYRGDRRPVVRWGAGPGESAWSALVADLGRPTVALLIDDWGNSRSEAARQLSDLPAPLTMAVLPHLPFSRYFALKATDLALPGGAVPTGGDRPDGRDQRLAAGCFVDFGLGSGQAKLAARRREVMLHLPMEPQDYPANNPGPDAILVGMGRRDIAQRLDDALEGLPNVSGVNNHMGSAATADGPTMRAVMAELAARDLFFVDSLTSSRSVAYDEALAAGLPALKNRIFLDYDNEDDAKIAANLDRLVQAARSRGFALGIGHPHPATARVLAREIPRLQAAGVRFVTVSELMALQDVATPAVTP